MRAKRVFVAVGVVAIAVQATILAWISVSQYRTFALTVDFSIYQHAFVEIVLGDYNPDATYVGGLFFQNHGEAIMWPIAVLLRFLDPAAALLLVQDAATVGVWILTVVWIARLVERTPQGWDVANASLASVCAAAAIIDPWFLWADAQDFHFEALASFFLLAAFAAFFSGRLALGLIASAGCILCGDVSATYAVGLGTYLLFFGWTRRWCGVAIAAACLGWLWFLHSLAVQRGASLPGIYGGLIPNEPHATDSAFHLAFAVLTHPATVLGALQNQAVNIYANIAPAGILGILSPSALALAGVSLLENNLASGRLFSQPSFQSFPIYTALGIGTFGVLSALRTRVSQTLALALGALVAANAAVWFAVIVPNLKERWLNVRPSTARVLRDAYYGSSHSTQIVSSQGVLGRFGAFAASSFFVQGIALRSEPLTVLVTPYDGINTLDVNADFANLAALTRRGAKIVEHERGAWWLQYWAPLGDPRLFLPFESRVVEAWVLDADHGHPVLEGEQDDWHLEGDGVPGYVMDHDYWRYPLGAYVGVVEMANAGPVNYEILNATGLTSIFRRTIPPGPRRLIEIPFENAVLARERYFHGFGPFRFEPFALPKNDALESRIWSDGRARVNIYKVGIKPAPRRNLLQ